MIYLDNNATTRPFDSVIEAMAGCMRTRYANPASISAAFTGVDEPRREAAKAMVDLLGAEGPECLTFTSGATEANNWVFGPIVKRHPGRTIVISSIEHASVAEPAWVLASLGFNVLVAPVTPEGALDLARLPELLGPDVALLSIMAANNETGAIQPLREAGQILRSHSPNAIFHTDATQCVGKIPVDLETELADVDLLSFSAHKFHGPKGIGGLYIRPGTDISPMFLGGGQEAGLRSGTDNTPALAGLAVAAREIAAGLRASSSILRDEFEKALLEAFPSALIHSGEALRLPNTSFFALPGLEATDAAIRLSSRGIVVGTGAACSSGAISASPTLVAMGVEHAVALGSLRVSSGHLSCREEFTQLVATLREEFSIN